ncbi:MAG TPA: DinB family protein [Candidatus Acidoferrales bacterium]|nr:DinB family protein [Candidatus Acidoferrales bacterium]
MDAKEIFLRIWDREAKTTAKVFRAFPLAGLDVKPHERSRSIRDLAWQCVTDEGVIEKIIDGVTDLRDVPPSPPPPQTMEEVASAYEAAHRAASEKMRRLETQFSKTVTVSMRGGCVQLEQAETIWGNLLDQIHHRGQLTIYLRQAQGKVPAIYGPSGDEGMGFIA